MELMTEKYLREKEAYDEDAVTPDSTTDADEDPRVYVHVRCHEATAMPDHVRRNYLADPCFYSSFLGTVCSHSVSGIAHGS